MTKALCIKDGFMESGERFAKKGRVYDIVNETHLSIAIKTEVSDYHTFSLCATPKEGGFESWFVKVSDGYNSVKHQSSDNATRHRELIDAIHDTYVAKNHDYGDSFHVLYEKFGLISSLVRMSDKMNRLESLAQREAQVKDESIRDTLLDLANYAIMTVMEIDSKEATHES